MVPEVSDWLVGGRSPPAWRPPSDSCQANYRQLQALLLEAKVLYYKCFCHSICEGSRCRFVEGLRWGNCAIENMDL